MYIGLGLQLYNPLIYKAGRIPFLLKNYNDIDPTVGKHVSHTVGAGSVLNSDDYYQLLDADVAKKTGARYGINLIKDATSATSSEDFSSGSWALSDVTNELVTTSQGAANKIVCSGAADPFFYIQPDMGEALGGRSFVYSIDLWIDDGEPTEATLYIIDASYGDINSKSITLTTTKTRYSIATTFPVSEADTSLLFRVDLKNSPTAGDYLYANYAMPEETTAHADVTKPSKYVSAGVGLGDDKVPSTSFADWTDSTVPDGWGKTGTHNGTNYVEEGGSGGLRIVSDNSVSVGISLTGVAHEGQDYILIITASDTTTSQLNLLINGTLKTVTLTAGVQQRHILTAGSSPDYIEIRRAGVTDVTLSEFSVKTLNQNANKNGHKIFPTTNATSVDVNGVVTEALGTALTTMKGGLCQPERTNLALESSNFGNWTNATGGGVTLTQNNRVGLDGKTSMALIAQIDSTADGFNDSITLAATTEYTYTVAIENNNSTRSRTRVYNNDTALNVAEIVFDWTGKVPSTFSSSGASNITYEHIRDDIYEVSFTFTSTTATSLYSIIVYPEYGTTATNSIWLDHVQVEAGPNKTNRIYTAGAAVTRTASVDSKVYDASLVNDVVFTFEFTPSSDVQEQWATLFGCAGDNVDGFNLQWDNTKFRAYRWISSVGSHANKAHTLVAGTTISIKCRYSSTSGIDIWLDDVKGTNSATATDVSPDSTIYIGSRHSTIQTNGDIKNFRIIEGDLTDAQVVAL